MNIAGIMASQAAMRQAVLNANISTKKEQEEREQEHEECKECKRWTCLECPYTDI